MSQLANAASVLQGAIAAFAGESVTITRGTTTITIPDAVPSRPELITDDVVVGRIEAEAMDWTVRAASYTFDDNRPAEGDTITRGNGEIYELMHPPYRLSDSAGVRFRMYSKKVS